MDLGHGYVSTFTKNVDDDEDEEEKDDDDEDNVSEEDMDWLLKEIYIVRIKHHCQSSFYQHSDRVE